MLLDFNGFRFSALICNKRCQGIIQVEEAGVYLCQDFVDGAEAENRNGFKYSWYVCRGSFNDLITHGVKRFEIEE